MHGCVVDADTTRSGKHAVKQSVVDRKLLIVAAMFGLVAVAAVVAGSRIDQASASNVISLAAGATHSCLITSGGGVKCWGFNGDGQLGIGSVENEIHFVPEDVVGLDSGVVALVAGRFHSCALLATGGVKCWGASLYLGNGSETASSVPVDVIGLDAAVVQISSTFWHTCALTVENDLKCWGMNDSLQLGADCGLDACFTPLSVVEVQGNVASVAAGRTHTCIITLTGSVECWGRNGVGQLGNGLTDDSTSPVEVLGLDDQVVSISASLHT